MPTNAPTTVTTPLAVPRATIERRSSIPARMADRSPGRLYARGDIWLIDENKDQPPTGVEMWANRPGIIVSNDISSNRAGFVQVVYTTTSNNKRPGPTHIDIIQHPSRQRSLVLAEQIHTVDISRLRRHIGVVDDPSMQKIDKAIKFSLSLDDDSADKKAC